MLVPNVCFQSDFIHHYHFKSLVIVLSLQQGREGGKELKDASTCKRVHFQHILQCSQEEIKLTDTRLPGKQTKSIYMSLSEEASHEHMVMVEVEVVFIEIIMPS